jgi:hypothetical protein
MSDPTVMPLGQETQTEDSAAPAVTFADAAFQVQFVQMQFAHARDSYTDQVALEHHLNPQVSLWSNRFSDPETGRVAYTLGSCMDGATHEFQIRWDGLRAKYRKHHSCDCGRDDCPGAVGISLNTLKRHVRLLTDAGVAEILPQVRMWNQKRHGRGGGRENADDSNLFRVNFSRVLMSERIWDDAIGRWVKAYRVEAHDFSSISPHYRERLTGDTKESAPDPSMTPHCPLNDPSMTPYCSPSSEDCSNNCVFSSAEHEETAARIDPRGDEETGDRARSPAHLLSRNTFKVWTGKSGAVVWYNLSRAGKAPANAQVVPLSPDEAQYMWQVICSGDRDQDYADRAAYLQMDPDARAEKVFRWRHAADIKAQELRELEEAVRQEARAEQEAARAALRAEFDRLSARYDELSGRPGEADRHLGQNLRGPKGMPRLEVQVEHLRERVEQMEYEDAHKDDPPWTGDPSTLEPDTWMRSLRSAGRTQSGFVSPHGKVRQTYGRSGIKPGEVFGYFRWTPENGLEVAEPDGEAW